MLSKKCKYAIHSLIHIAKNPTEKHLIKDVSEICHIPKKFLEAILLDLKRAGILSSKSGKGGGYTLRLPPDQVNLAQVIRLFDGAIAAVPCASLNYYESCDECEDEETCSVKFAFIQVRNATVEMLKNETLETLLKKENKLLTQKRNKILKTKL
ncbi:Rrf2 family transcriptional regulator [Chryseolinea sp. H1M3-3]|uniref:RrF2 family transcriptional regulator n=1 Tax=Chryseolinea sp. H1M3-3 TaxID=3034144 RepID=UPI0023EC8D83|nr:Rrf2 family transcriptional regulator [Chryseolinea sp. H1M3-3]